MRNLSPRAIRPRAARAARRHAGSRSAACACRFSETLQRENELFETHLRRVNPELLDDDHALTFGGRKGASKRGQAQLSAEQKYEIAAQEYEELRDELETSRKTADKLVDTLKAQLEETEVRIAEVKKDAYEFKRDIVTGAENLRTGKTIAEKAVRYAEDKLRGKGATAEKLRLKNAALKAQIAKMESQLQQKEDMGEVLHVIDFDQLKIENQQCAMIEPGMAPEMVPRLRARAWMERNRCARPGRRAAHRPPRVHVAQVPREDRGAQQRAAPPQVDDGEHGAGAQHAEAPAEQPDGRERLAQARDGGAEGGAPRWPSRD